MRIVGPEGRVLGERHEGRIEFRGPSVTAGYYRQPEVTKKVLHDGWMDSGDLGYVAEGELFVTGRQKDMINKAGRKAAVEARRPVVPIGIAGTRAILDDRCLRAPGAIAVTIDPPLAPSGEGWPEMVRLRDLTRERIAALAGEQPVASRSPAYRVR